MRETIAATRGFADWCVDVVTELSQARAAGFRCPPEFLVIELDENDPAAVDFVYWIRRYLGRVRVLAITRAAESFLVACLHWLRIEGMCTRAELADDGGMALRRVAAGQCHWGEMALADRVRSLSPQSLVRRLALREWLVLSMVGQGRTHDAIARELCVSRDTIAGICRALHRKLGLEASRVALPLAAVREGVVRITAGGVVPIGWDLLQAVYRLSDGQRPDSSEPAGNQL